MSPTDSQDTPRSLLERLAHTPAEGDWRQLIGLYQPFINRWLSQAGVPTVDAEDLTQEILTVLIRELPEFRHSTNRGAFRKWLRTIVVNRTRYFWRSRKAGNSPGNNLVVLDALEDPDSGMSGQWDREHDAHVANKLLERIESEFSEVTWKAFLRQVAEGEKAAVVAAELGTSVNAVLIAKSRVLRRLRQEAAGLVDEI